MENQNQNNNGGYLFLMLGIIIAAVILSIGFGNIKEKGEVITVKGYAEMTIQSDYTVWEITINARQPSLAESYKKITSSKQRIREFLNNNGIQNDIISESSLSSYTIYQDEANGGNSNVQAYNMVQSLVITTKEIQKITELSLKINDLLSEGIELNSQPPKYYISDIGKYKIKMLGEALRDAQKRAEVIAKSVGNKVAGIKYARQGIFQITPKNSTEVSDWGMNDETSIVKSIKSVVDAAFYVK